MTNEEIIDPVPLTGQELIAKIKDLKAGDDCSAAKECGYQSMKLFYKAVAEAYQPQKVIKSPKKTNTSRGSTEVLEGRVLKIGPGVLKKVNANVGDLFLVSTEGSNIILTRFNKQVSQAFDAKLL